MRFQQLEKRINPLAHEKATGLLLVTFVAVVFSSYHMAQCPHLQRFFRIYIINRFRYCIWKDRKKPESKRKNLLRQGVNPDDAYAWSRTRMVFIELVEMRMENGTKPDPYFGKLITRLTTITGARLKLRGYTPMPDVYYELNPSFEACPEFFSGNRVVRDPYATWYCDMLSKNVRASPCRILPAG